MVFKKGLKKIESFSFIPMLLCKIAIIELYLPYIFGYFSTLWILHFRKSS